MVTVPTAWTELGAENAAWRGRGRVGARRRGARPWRRRRRGRGRRRHDAQSQGAGDGHEHGVGVAARLGGVAGASRRSRGEGEACRGHGGEVLGEEGVRGSWRGRRGDGVTGRGRGHGRWRARGGVRLPAELNRAGGVRGLRGRAEVLGDEAGRRGGRGSARRCLAASGQCRCAGRRGAARRRGRASGRGGRGGAMRSRLGGARRQRLGKRGGEGDGGAAGKGAERRLRGFYTRAWLGHGGLERLLGVRASERTRGAHRRPCHGGRGCDAGAGAQRAFSW